MVKLFCYIKKVWHIVPNLFVSDEFIVNVDFLFLASDDSETIDGFDQGSFQSLFPRDPALGQMQI